MAARRPHATYVVVVVVVGFGACTSYAVARAGSDHRSARAGGQEGDCQESGSDPVDARKASNGHEGHGQEGSGQEGSGEEVDPAPLTYGPSR